MLFRGESPEVMCSGWSENALTNPALFFSRYSRTINASGDNAVTLPINSWRLTKLDVVVLTSRHEAPPNQ